MSRKQLVIDTHFHIGVNPCITFIAEEELLPLMDQAGIDVQLVFQANEGAAYRTPDWNPYWGNDYVAKVQKMYPRRVLGLATINPWLQPPATYLYPSPKMGQPFDKIHRNVALEELERCITDLGLWGLKMHPFQHAFAVNSRALIFPMMRKLAQLQQDVKRRLLAVIHSGSDSPYNTPEAIADLARNFPELTFIMAHAGYIWGGSTLADTVGEVENVFIDLTACPITAVVIGAYRRCGPSRFTAGCDGPVASYRVKEAIVNALCETEEERELVLGGNLAKILGL